MTCTKIWNNMEAFAHNTPQKQNLLNLTSVKKFISLLKSIHVLLFFFLKHGHHTKVCLHYPHLFVLEFDRHRVTCRVLALHHVRADLGRDYHGILLTPERVLTEHKVGHGWGEALSWENCQLKWNKYDYNVCKNNISTKISNHFLIKETNSYCEVIQFCIFNKSRKYPRWLTFETYPDNHGSSHGHGWISVLDVLVCCVAVSLQKRSAQLGDLDVQLSSNLQWFFLSQFTKSNDFTTLHQYCTQVRRGWVIQKIGMYFLLPCTQGVGGV